MNNWLNVCNNQCKYCTYHAPSSRLFNCSFHLYINGHFINRIVINEYSLYLHVPNLYQSPHSQIFFNCLCYFPHVHLKKHKVFLSIKTGNLLRWIKRVYLEFNCYSMLSTPCSSFSMINQPILKSTCSFVGWEATYYHTYFSWWLNKIC